MLCSSPRTEGLSRRKEERFCSTWKTAQTIEGGKRAAKAVTTGEWKEFSDPEAIQPRDHCFPVQKWVLLNKNFQFCEGVHNLR